MNKKAIAYRLLALLPSLFCFSILIFFLSRLGPNQHIDKLSEEITKGSSENSNKIEKEIKSNLGFDLPLFYFSIDNLNSLPANFPFNKDEHYRKWQNLAFRLGNNKGVLKYCEDLMRYSSVYPELTHLYAISDTNQIKSFLKQNQAKYYSSVLLKSLKKNLVEAQTWKNYIPVLILNGSNNQYHKWISGVLRGNWGNSLVSGRPVINSISNAFSITLIFGTLSLFISLLIAIPLAIYSASNPNSRFNQILNSLFFSLHSTPSFWMGSLLILLFTNPIYFDWFPSYGFPSDSSENSLLEKIPYMVLPLICWSYSSLAIIYRHQRAAIIEELRKPYLQTAKAKGLSKHTLLWKHAFGNAKFPLITLIGLAIPNILSGSFVVEHLFSLPGMGELSLTAFQQKDYPLIYAIVLLAGLISFLAMLLSDLLYLYHKPDLAK